MTTEDTPSIRRRGLLSAAGSLPLIVGGIPRTVGASDPFTLTIEFEEHGSGIEEQTIAPGEQYTLALTVETFTELSSLFITPLNEEEHSLCFSDEFFIVEVSDEDNWQSECEVGRERSWEFDDVPGDETIKTTVTIGTDTTIEEQVILTGGSARSGSRSIAQFGGLTISEDGTSPPTINHLIEPEQWFAVEQAPSGPTFEVDVSDADTVELEATAYEQPHFDEAIGSDTIALENDTETTWSGELTITGFSPGTWVDLTVRAENGAGEVTKDQFAVENAFDRGDFDSEFAVPHHGGNLGYYIFDEVLTCNVAVAQFADRDPFEGEPDINTGADLQAWQEAIAYDVNTWFGSMKGSMGAVGFDMHFLQPEAGSVFTLPRTIEEYQDESAILFDPAGIREFHNDLEDVVSADGNVDIDDNDAEFYIGTYLGDSNRLDDDINGRLDRRNFSIDKVFVPMLRYPAADFDGINTVGATRGTWFHELLHAAGLDHIYEYGELLDVAGVMDDSVRVDNVPEPPENVADKLTTSTFIRLGLPTEERGYELSPSQMEVEWIPRDDIDVEDDITGNEYTFTQKETAAFSFDDADTLPTFTYETTHRPRVRSVTDRATYLIDVRELGPDRTGPFLIRETRHGADAGADDRGLNITRVAEPTELPEGGTVRDVPGIEDPIEVIFELDELDDSGDVLEAEMSLRVGFDNSKVARLRDGSATTDRAFPCAETEHTAIDNPTLPSLDLKAVDPETDEVIVGVDETGEYVVDPDDTLAFVRASGKRKMGLEWIAVPEDADVDFVVASDDVDTYNERVGDEHEIDDIGYSISVVNYGENAALTRVDDDDRTFDVTDTDVRVVDDEPIDPGVEVRSDPDQLRAAVDIATIEPALDVTEQYVELVNTGSDPIDLTDVEIGPDADPDTAFTFGEIQVEPGETVAVWTAAEPAVDESQATANIDVYWGRDDRVWDRERDTVWVRDDGETLIRDRYNKQLPPIGDQLASPRDLDEDGLYEDVAGDGEFTVDDVELLFDRLSADRVQQNAEAFNFSGTDPDRVTVADVQALYARLSSGGG